MITGSVSRAIPEPPAGRGHRVLRIPAQITLRKLEQRDARISAEFTQLVRCRRELIPVQPVDDGAADHGESRKPPD